MGWVDEQLRQREKADRTQFQEAFEGMAGVVMGRLAAEAETASAKNAIEDLFRYFRLDPAELPADVTELNDQLDYLLRPTGIMRRVVTLEKGWHKDAVGAMLTTTRDGALVALIPGKLSGYTYFDTKSGKRLRVNARTADALTGEAIVFYRPLPLKKLGIKDLILYIAQTLSVSDYVLIALVSLAFTLVGLTLPYVNSVLFSTVITSGMPSILVSAAVLLVGTTIARTMITVTQSLVMSRIETKLAIAVEAASMMRVLMLPASFFRKYSSGELSSRVQNINNLCSMLTSAILTSGLTSLFSITYVFQIFRYTPALVVPALGIILATLAISVITVLTQMRLQKKRMELSAREGGLIYALFAAVQKIKLAGAERRSFAKWAETYRESAELMYNPPFLLKLSGVFSVAISLIGSIVLYYAAVRSGTSVSDYMAFTMAYGMVSAAFLSLVNIVNTVAGIKPTLEMVEPILHALPEIEKNKKIVTRVSGSIDINNVSFRYNEDMPYVLDNLSLRIRAGQYVAIVGQTGCGKSTLLRMLLGFEKPEKGAVYYDRNDIATVDMASLRKNIGCVIQNGKLFSGSIFANIVVSAPWLTLDDAWQAARLADVADDIEDMPMGMNTIISEGGGGISGGQKQRLMIARAVVNSPRILMFDEATSALDNITQKKVSEALDALKCTRIVIAHRLSTIRHCDRIIVLDKGSIAEDGTYDELIARQGMFADLVARQQVGDTA